MNLLTCLIGGDLINEYGFNMFARTQDDLGVRGTCVLKHRDAQFVLNGGHSYSNTQIIMLLNVASNCCFNLKFSARIQSI